MTPSLQDNPLISQWLVLHSNGTVTAFTGKSELGQGVATALAQIVATELGVPLDRVRMQAPSTDRSPNEGFTAGSLSIQHSGTALQSAARAARHLLVQEAGARGVDPLAVMGELDLDIPVSSVEVPGDSQAPPGAIGLSVPRRDLDAKILGEPAFIHDVRLPGMRFCRVIRPPYRGAQLVDQPDPSGLPGDTAVIRDGSFVAVVASLERHAIAASALVADRCRWVGEPPALDDQQVTAFLLSAPTDDTVLAEGTGHDAELPADSAALTAR
ncbi:MAG: molybdopterin cofactor-binding domain-containing protein, partial [Candidatus Nanopelagicales bacterium]